MVFCCVLRWIGFWLKLIVIKIPPNETEFNLGIFLFENKMVFVCARNINEKWLVWRFFFSRFLLCFLNFIFELRKSLCLLIIRSNGRRRKLCAYSYCYEVCLFHYLWQCFVSHWNGILVSQVFNRVSRYLQSEKEQQVAELAWTFWVLLSWA